MTNPFLITTALIVSTGGKLGNFGVKSVGLQNLDSLNPFYPKPSHLIPADPQQRSIHQLMLYMEPTLLQMPLKYLPIYQH